MVLVGLAGCAEQLADSGGGVDEATIVMDVPDLDRADDENAQREPGASS